ncbi:hypothetical protein ADK57_25205 [Streptomyces sp. MMG1533]|nr:hypothetical protein ADK57_25205 [Streptomyces sp. MMG1533]
MIQVFDRDGEYTAGRPCIRTDNAKADDSCLQEIASVLRSEVGEEGVHELGDYHPCACGCHC